MNRFFVRMQMYQAEVLFERNARGMEKLLGKGKEMGLNVAVASSETEAESIVSSFLSS